MPKAARAAVVVALLLALVSGLSVRSGPIMLLGICFAALLSAFGMLRRRAWSAYGFAFLLALSMLAVLYFAVTGQSSGGFLQVSIGLIIYFGIAVLFFMAGLGLSLTGAKRGTPVPWILMALLFSVPFLFFRPMSLPTGSMEDTLLIGDFLLVDRFATHPAFGDIVVFHYPLDRVQIYAKRVVGLPGDHIHFVDGKLYRNGAPVNEVYVTHKLPVVPAGIRNFPAGLDGVALQTAGRAMLSNNVAGGEVVVPPGKYFVLGDNRDKLLRQPRMGLHRRRRHCGQAQADLRFTCPRSGRHRSLPHHASADPALGPSLQDSVKNS